MSIVKKNRFLFIIWVIIIIFLAFLIFLFLINGKISAQECNLMEGYKWYDSIQKCLIEKNNLTEENNELLEKNCLESGGIVVRKLCCKDTKAFPNNCLIGACGCALENSHEIKVCDCDDEKCFDGRKCISR